MEKILLKAIPLFAPTSEESLEKLAPIVKRHFYKKNNLLFDYAQMENTFLYVVNGWVKLFKENAEGTEIIVDILTKHQFCGESFIFETHEKESFKALSISDVELITVPIPAMRYILETDFAFATSFLRALLQKQNMVNKHREHISTQNASERIACFILQLCEQTNFKQDKLTLHLPYDKTLVASHLGMRPETFSRALNTLRKKCGVHVHGSDIDIDHPATLVRYVYEHCSNIHPCHLNPSEKMH